MKSEPFRCFCEGALSSLALKGLNDQPTESTVSLLHFLYSHLNNDLMSSECNFSCH